jgi:transcriptional regulator with XRE-family HTH domain
MTSIQKTIGSAIEKRRTELKMDQSFLSDYSTIGITTISTLENGKGNISVGNLQKILDVLGLEISVNIKKSERL